MQGMFVIAEASKGGVSSRRKSTPTKEKEASTPQKRKSTKTW